MQKTKRSYRILSMLLTAALLLSLMPLMGIPAMAAAPTRTTRIYLLKDSPSSNKLSDEGWAWYKDGYTPEGGAPTIPGMVLVLDGINLVTNEQIPLTMPGNATIVLKGTNVITSTYSGGDLSSEGLHTDGSGSDTLTIVGDGNLFVKSSNSSNASNGIAVAGNLIVDCTGSITATSGVGRDSNAISVTGNCSITSCDIIATATGGAEYSIAVNCQGNMTFNSGSITAQCSGTGKLSKAAIKVKNEVSGVVVKGGLNIGESDTLYYINRYYKTGNDASAASATYAVMTLAPTQAPSNGLAFTAASESITYSDGDTGTAKWDKNNCTLTLTDFDYETGAIAALTVPDGTTMVLGGDNKITSTQQSGTASYGIDANGALTISGEGTLTATSGDSSGSPNENCGIRVGGLLTVDDKTTVTANGGAAIDSGYSYGLNAGNLTVVGSGKLIALGGTADASQSIAVKLTAASEAPNVTAKGSNTDDGLATTELTFNSNYYCTSGTTPAKYAEITRSEPTQSESTRTTPLDLTADLFEGVAPASTDIDKSNTEGWAWTASTKTLTLNGLVLKTSDPGPSIRLPAGAKIMVLGDSSVTNTSTSGITYSIYAAGRLDVQGDSNLTVKSGNSATSYGLRANGLLTVSSGVNLTVTGGNATLDSYGIYAFTGVELSGTVTATGGNVTGNTAKSQGLVLNGGTSIISGTVTVSGGNVTGNTVKSQGLVLSDGTAIISGTVTAIGGTVATGESNGLVVSDNKVNITCTGSGIITASGGSAAVKSAVALFVDAKGGTTGVETDKLTYDGTAGAYMKNAAIPATFATLSTPTAVALKFDASDGSPTKGKIIDGNSGGVIYPKPSGITVSDDGKTYTLTDFDFTTDYDCAIYLPAGSILILFGSNSFSSSTGSGIHGAGGLTLQGTGSLAAKGNTSAITLEMGDITLPDNYKFSNTEGVATASGPYTYSNADKYLLLDLSDGGGTQPTAEHFNYISQATYDGTPKSAGVTAKSGGPTGTITVYYDGATTVPTRAGTYAITIDVAAAGNYTAATNLSLGDFVITDNIPAAPQNLTATAGDGQATLRWDSVPDAVAYNVYRNNTKITNVTTTSYTDTGVTNGTQYSFTVTAVGTDGAESLPSAPVTVTPTAPSSGGNTGGGGGSSPAPSNEITAPTTDEGWNSAADKINDLKDGENFTVNMGSQTTIPASFLEDIAGKDVELTFDMGGGLVWTVNGKDIPEGTLSALNLDVKIGTGSIPEEVRDIDGSLSEVQLQLNHNGEFGFTLTLSVALDKQNAGHFANLFYYNPKTGELEFMQAVIIGADGTVDFTFDHASDYLIAVAETSMEPAVWQNPFTDVKESDWFYKNVQYVFENGLMNGTSDTTFEPNLTLSRAMLVTILYRAAGSPEVEPMYAAHMMDVVQPSWYEDAMGWAVKEGILTGYGEGMFGPEDPVTREQLVTILYRYAQFAGMDVSVGEDTNILSYEDAFGISEYAISAFQWACGAGIVDGKPGGLLDPQGTATRAETAAVLQRFLEK